MKAGLASTAQGRVAIQRKTDSADMLDRESGALRIAVG